MGEILDWFEEVAPGEERRVTVLDAETELFGALRERGYHEETEGRFFLHLRRGLDDLPLPVVPEGYTLRSVRGEEDAPARALVHAAAFVPSRVTAESYRQVMRASPYRKDLDWLVEAPDGTPVAFCLVWLDEVNRVAIMEPVGTDPGHRRLGLASAAILAALRAARDGGAQLARVCARGDADYPSARATYESLGFRPYARNVSFGRPNNGGASVD